MSDPPAPVYDVIVPLVLYPVDKISSLLIALNAPFDPDIEIRWGPLGALVGIAVPWVTLIPDFYGPPPPGDLVLEPGAFDRLIARVNEGDGVRAYVETFQVCGWRGGADALHSVRVVEAAPAGSVDAPSR
jgi:hypothetical protein